MEIVTMKKEWLNEGESVHTRYIVVEDNGDRLFISPLHCTLPIVPRELVRRHMVESHGTFEMEVN